jgi:hypothetical protein
MLKSEPLSADISLTPEHRESIRENGYIENGPLAIWIEGELVRVEMRAAADIPTLRYWFRILEEVERLHGRYYVLYLVREQVRPPPAENRRLIASWVGKHPYSGIAVVAPHNPIFVAISSLVVRAASLLWQSKQPAVFFATEAEAREWLDALRRRNELELGPRGASRPRI